VVVTRALQWDGCANVRDLGGLPTADGGETRRGAIVRSDNAHRLTDAGWESLVAHGVRTVLDLRWPEERAEDPPRELPIDAVHVSLFGDLDHGFLRELDERLATYDDPAERTRESYLAFLERNHAELVRAIAEIADAPDGGIVVHCAAGKDRTGLVSALLLRLAGVSVEDVADDYAVSETNLAELLRKWIDEAADEEERAKRTWLSGTPRAAMVGVLEQLDRRYGGVREYLLAGGATEDQVERAAARLR
jgi:protein tyrosine/serine phosphatase